LRSRTPIAYAVLLIVALLAAVGLAAYSANTDSGDSEAEAVTTVTAAQVSARVASALLALTVTPEAPAPPTAVDSAPVTTSGTASTETEAVAPATDEPTTASDEPSEDATTAAPTPPPPAPTDTTPPRLTITSPEDGATVTDRIVTIAGNSEPGAAVFSGPFDAEVASDGHWTIRLVLAPGPNGVAMTAGDTAGNETTIRIVVHYDAPTTTTVTPTTAAAPSSPTTTAGSPPATTTTSQWSPNWPADSGGQRNVEQWRSVVAKHWPADKVDCVLGIIKRESRGDPRAYNSSSGASGLMQHLSKYWKGRAAGAGFVDANGLYATPYNGEANIAAGAYLANYYEGIGRNWYAPWNRLFDYGSCLADG